MAGVTGIEPVLAVLETVVLPLYDTPKRHKLYEINVLLTSQILFSSNLGN